MYYSSGFLSPKNLRCKNITGMQKIDRTHMCCNCVILINIAPSCFSSTLLFHQLIFCPKISILILILLTYLSYMYFETQTQLKPPLSKGSNPCLSCNRKIKISAIGIVLHSRPLQQLSVDQSTDQSTTRGQSRPIRVNHGQPRSNEVGWSILLRSTDGTFDVPRFDFWLFVPHFPDESSSRNR